MIRFARRLILNRRPRRWVAAAALVNYLALCSGIPLPLGVASPVDGRPYPCQHHRCGCGSAEKCWQSCCCMTMAEKLAWARQNGVTPPDYVVAAARREAEPASHGCKHCQVRTQALGVRSQRAGVDSQHTDDETPNTKHQTQDSIWVIALAAQKCRGESSNWLSVPWSVTPASPMTCGVVPAAVSPLCERPLPAQVSPSFSPPDPPPRAA